MSTLNEFLAKYNPNGEHLVTVIDVQRGETSPFILISDGDRTALINPLALSDHLCLDVHSFVNGEQATSGAFGMTNGKRVQFPDTGTTSHGWASTSLVAVLVGEQE